MNKSVTCSHIFAWMDWSFYLYIIFSRRGASAKNLHVGTVPNGFLSLSFHESLLLMLATPASSLRLWLCHGSCRLLFVADCSSLKCLVRLCVCLCVPCPLEGGALVSLVALKLLVSLVFLLVSMGFLADLFM